MKLNVLHLGAAVQPEEYEEIKYTLLQNIVGSKHSH